MSILYQLARGAAAAWGVGVRRTSKIQRSGRHTQRNPLAASWSPKPQADPGAPSPTPTPSPHTVSTSGAQEGVALARPVWAPPQEPLRLPESIFTDTAHLG